jgi:2-oxoisovalerate dehydrogenase E2 component (dihydrolipoyl transacylase)
LSRFVFKLPDLGEGTVEAEIVSWRVQPGDVVNEDDVLVEVTTDKAAVEVPSPVTGRVVARTGEPGDRMPVGSELIVLETDAVAAAAPQPEPEVELAQVSGGQAPRAGRVATSPAIRRRAHEGGIDLTQVAGSGPNGRIVRKDLEAYIASRAAAPRPGNAARARPANLRSVEAGERPLEKLASRPAATALPSVPTTAPAQGGTREIKVAGVRRVIAERMIQAKRSIPHFSYVEEVDVTELERLRQRLNSKQSAGAAPLTYLPFLAQALVRVLKSFPQCNALYDAERGVIVQHTAVHLGIATQTPDGLKVPVVRDVQARSLWETAAEMRRVAEAARDGTATREELTGSTLTISSLGKLGGIASTPIINAPEVAIVGINRAVERPVVVDGNITVRRMMNLSSSFDHRFVDGHDAAAMIQALKERLEEPALIFID